MKEYSLGPGACRIFPTEGYKGKWPSYYRGSKNGTPAEVWGETPKAENIF